MEIILMRHGKPSMAPRAFVTAAQMGDWIECYELSTVRAETVPPQKVELANSAAIIVTSTSARTVSSAEALGREPSLEDDLFREAELPYADWSFLRMSPTAWAAFFRLMWLFGYSDTAESLRAARLRAKAAAGRLISFTASGPVLLIGHGVLNRLIARELLAAGWRGPRYPDGGYWGCSVYRSRT